MRASEGERRARAALTAGCEPADASLGRAVAELGAEAALERLRARGGGRLPDPAALLGHAAGIGVRFVVPGDPEWPSQLDDLGDEAPLGLWVRGSADLRLLALRSVAVVGARAATEYGVRAASALASDLAERGWCVVSGGAFGIDAGAHRGAIAAGGRTVVVLPCGVDVSYPAAHDTLFGRCAASGGLVVSEAPPGEPARRWRFLDRNRLIAALSRGTVVVEAAHRSGALSTARRADDLGRRVMAVPGPITSAASAGTHAAIRRGAVLVTCADHVVEEVGGGPARDDEVGLDEVAPEHRSLLGLVRAGPPATAERLAARAGLPLPEALAALAALELAGMVECRPAGWAPTAGEGPRHARGA